MYSCISLLVSFTVWCGLHHVRHPSAASVSVVGCLHVVAVLVVFYYYSTSNAFEIFLDRLFVGILCWGRAQALFMASRNSSYDRGCWGCMGRKMCLHARMLVSFLLPSRDCHLQSSPDQSSLSPASLTACLQQGRLSSFSLTSSENPCCQTANRFPVFQTRDCWFSVCRPHHLLWRTLPFMREAFLECLAPRS